MTLRLPQDIYYDTEELRHLVKLGKGAKPTKDKPNVDEDPSIDPDYSNWGEPASVNYIGLIPYLVKSIQELNNRIIELEKKTV